MQSHLKVGRPKGGTKNVEAFICKPFTCVKKCNFSFQLHYLFPQFFKNLKHILWDGKLLCLSSSFYVSIDFGLLSTFGLFFYRTCPCLFASPLFFWCLLITSMCVHLLQYCATIISRVFPWSVVSFPFFFGFVLLECIDVAKQFHNKRRWDVE